MSSLLYQGTNLNGYLHDANEVTVNTSTTGSSATDGQAALNELYANEGTFEPANVAAYAHAVGEYFLWKGQFVKVTAAIAVGNTIAIGTNVAATNIAAILGQLNSNIARLKNNVFSTFQNITSELPYTVTENTLLVKVTMNTGGVVNGGAEFYVNGLPFFSMYQSTAGTQRVAYGNMFQVFQGDVINAAAFSAGGEVSVYKAV